MLLYIMASTAKGRPTSIDSKVSVGKKRRHVLSGSEDDGKGTPSASKRYCNEFPMSKIYNSSFKSNKPAELFRKDLISAMKLPDTEQFNPDEYWSISDTWKEEWEKGVQVPVNPDGLPEMKLRVLNEKKRSDFRMPKKLLRCTVDKDFSPDIHVLSNAVTYINKVCSYDLDVVDVEWLKIMNEELKIIGLSELEEVTMELILEEIETQCYDNLQDAIRSEEGLGIEYDDDVICDVCRSPDSEEGNEMVFCDACNVCVHQACYGITKIPEGSWVCRTCALGIRPTCFLCPNRGGAMKSTRSGQKWTHVSCALWIPEVAIEDVDKMEPITKISEIPASRWNLICTLCREKCGACIQCSVKTCKTAYHVTCAFHHGLAMKAIIDGEEEEDDVDLKSYCSKHTKERKGVQSDGDLEKLIKSHNRKELEMSSEEKANARLAKMQEMEAEFYHYVHVHEVADSLEINPTIVDFVFQYWKLKRRANFNKPLITPRTHLSETTEMKQCNSLYARMKMFVHLRQDLERVRNLCYMVNKREKLSRSWYRIRQNIFQKQAALVTDTSLHLKENELQAVLDANHSDSVYDIMSSCQDASTPSITSILSILDSNTVFIKKESPNNFRHNKSLSSIHRLPNPYAKHYLNGILKRSQRPASESHTDQENKNKSSNETQETLQQINKDLYDDKFASLQETYKLKPMEIVVDKLPEDHTICLQASRFYERIENSFNKISAKSHKLSKNIHIATAKKTLKCVPNSVNSHRKMYKSSTKSNDISRTVQTNDVYETNVAESSKVESSLSREEIKAIPKNMKIQNRKIYSRSSHIKMKKLAANCNMKNFDKEISSNFDEQHNFRKCNKNESFLSKETSDWMHETNNTKRFNKDEREVLISHNYKPGSKYKVLNKNKTCFARNVSISKKDRKDSSFVKVNYEQGSDIWDFNASQSSLAKMSLNNVRKTALQMLDTNERDDTEKTTGEERLECQNDNKNKIKVLDPTSVNYREESNDSKSSTINTVSVAAEASMNVEHEIESEEYGKIKLCMLNFQQEDISDKYDTNLNCNRTKKFLKAINSETLCNNKTSSSVSNEKPPAAELNASINSKLSHKNLKSINVMNYKMERKGSIVNKNKSTVFCKKKSLLQFSHRSENVKTLSNSDICSYSLEVKEKSERPLESSAKNTITSNVSDCSYSSGPSEEVQSKNTPENKIRAMQEKVNENSPKEIMPAVNSGKEQNTETSPKRNSVLNSTNCDINSKKQSPKLNVSKYNHLTDKVTSPTGTNCGRVSSPNKDVYPGREKLRQESAKIRESLFSVNTFSTKSLSGYKIPKKLKTNSTDYNVIENKRENFTVSPLSEVSQHSQTGSYSLNGYHTERYPRRWQNHFDVRTENQGNGQKLVLKLHKDSNHSNVTRWHSDANSNNRTDSLYANANETTSPIVDSDHCDRDISSLESHSRSERELECRTSQDNTYFSPFNQLPQTLHNGDYWLSYA